MYKLETENELIRQARAGNSAACEQLLAAYTGLFKRMSHRYSHTPAGKTIAEDAMGILYEAFMNALQDFAPARGINFAAFLQSRLHGALYKNFQQTCNYQKRTVHPQAPDSADNRDYFDMLESPLPTPEQQLLLRNELASILALLNKNEKQLLSLLYLQDLPQITAARHLHISPQALNKRKQKLIAKLKKLA